MTAKVRQRLAVRGLPALPTVLPATHRPPVPRSGDVAWHPPPREDHWKVTEPLLFLVEELILARKGPRLSNTAGAATLRIWPPPHPPRERKLLPVRATPRDREQSPPGPLAGIRPESGGVSTIQSLDHLRV